MTDRFCSSCGQPRTDRLGLRDVVSAALAKVASFDTAFLWTFIGLTRDELGQKIGSV